MLADPPGLQNPQFPTDRLVLACGQKRIQHCGQQSARCALSKSNHGDAGRCLRRVQEHVGKIAIEGDENPIVGHGRGNNGRAGQFGSRKSIGYG